MEIIKVEFFPVKLKLRVPSIVAYGGGDEVENIVVKLTTADGKTGWGNCAPDAYVTGEHPDRIQQLIQSNEISSLFKGKDIYSISVLEQLLLRELSEFPSIRAGISIALWDTLAKCLGLPLLTLLGRARYSIPTSITIPLLPLSEIKDLALEYKEQGFQYPKIKLGGDIDSDLQRIHIVREVFGREIPIRLDANQSYSAEKALELLSQLQEHKISIEFFEQPTPAQLVYSLKQVTTLSPGVPIMADESALNCKDILYLAQLGAANLFNIKLMKCGGVESARRANYVAQCMESPTMMGCMDESVVSVASALAVCLSNENFQFADLDGHFEFENDVATGGVRLENGMLYPVDAPGLGLQVNL
ncbi:dipeptide epimerase [Candidatus Sumerlaeota bacterium]|nr:dipeptide epimerase [Candidatus Sumerlaeota bacterium]